MRDVKVAILLIDLLHGFGIDRVNSLVENEFDFDKQLQIDVTKHPVDKNVNRVCDCIDNPLIFSSL